MSKVDQMKLGIAALAAALTSLWGWFGWVVFALVVFMAVDYVSGTMAAVKNQDWSSAAARDGIWHKCGCILAVAVAGMADLLIGILVEHFPLPLPFEFPAFFCPLVVVWYLITEMGSILENAARMGAPVPGFLKKMLAITMDAMNDAGEHLTDGKEHDDE